MSSSGTPPVASTASHHRAAAQPSPGPSHVPKARVPTAVLCVSGSVAAFKAVEVARSLGAAGVRVLPVMTRAATRFLGSASLHALTGEPVRSDMFEPAGAGELHVELAAAADVVVVAPATADLLESLAHGRANDLVRATLLCSRCPVVLAPAMHPRMWEQRATQRNVTLLREDERIRLVGPVHGAVANGEVGLGRMADPVAIVQAALDAIGEAAVLAAPSRGPLVGRHVVVTAGPTVEEIDPVRFVSNRSSGKMGFAVAERAAARGARVTLVSGPVALATPPGVERIDVRSAEQMRDALHAVLGPALDGADALVMAAAVADFRPAERVGSKIHRESSGASITLELVPNPDLLAEIGAARRGGRPVCVGFALGSGTDESLLERARAKLTAKKVDLIVANLAVDAFDREDNRVTLVRDGAAVALDRMSKRAVADRLLDWLEQQLGATGAGAAGAQARTQP